MFDDGASSGDEISDFDLARMFGERLGFGERLVHLGEDVHQLAVNDSSEHLPAVGCSDTQRSYRQYVASGTVLTGLNPSLHMQSAHTSDATLDRSA